MARTNPTKIPGRWRDGFALDYHTTSSTYLGEDEYGHAVFDTRRSELGELLYRLKYKSDQGVLIELADTVAGFVHGWPIRTDALIPVPSTRYRAIQPVISVGKLVAERMRMAFLPGVLARTRETPELKNVYDYHTRTELLAGLHSVAPGGLEGRRVLLFDDLYRSGATMNAVTEVLYEQGRAGDVFALAITRTRSNV